MNCYRNWQFHLSNILKQQFKELVSPKLKGKKFDSPSIEYFLHFPDSRRRDKMNFVAVVSKFFLDTLVECGCVQDDNDSFIGRESAETLEKDKENPRCDIVLTEL